MALFALLSKRNTVNTSKLIHRHWGGGHKYSELLSCRDSLPEISRSVELSRSGLIPEAHLRKSNFASMNIFQELLVKPAFSQNRWLNKSKPFSFTGAGTSRPYHTTPSLFSASDPSEDWLKDGKTYHRGPDQILPSRAAVSWSRKGAVQIKVGESGFESLRPLSVPTMLTNAVKKFPNNSALLIMRDDVLHSWTYTEYLRDVRTAAKGFIALGLERFHAVCIMGFNAPEWLISDFGAIFAGGFAAGIYTTNSPEACQYCAVHSEANIFVVEDEEQLAKILKIRSQLPHLKAIVQYTGTPTTKGVLSWADLMNLGNQQPERILEERLQQISLNQCSTIIYTSGTTGNPKGVMLRKVSASNASDSLHDMNQTVLNCILSHV